MSFLRAWRSSVSLYTHLPTTVTLLNMRSFSFIGASALISLAATVEGKHDVHGHLEAIHRRHRQERESARKANETLVRRGTCAFPTNDGLVAVTPGSGNGGWAFAPDQSCTPGRYCPYACPPNQVSMQWDPSVTSYTYPGSMVRCALA